MNNLLTVLASHYAHLHPSVNQHYLALANHYETLALGDFTCIVTNITEQNCHAYCVLAAFIVVRSTASIADGRRGDETLTPKDVAQLLELIRGISVPAALPENS